ncbi:MAG: DUF3347 domain-containing protein [Flavobacteriales bacterium]
MKPIFNIIILGLLSISLFQCSAKKRAKTVVSNKTEEHDHSTHSHPGEHNHDHPYMAKSTEIDTMKTNGFAVLYAAYFKITESLSLDDKTKTADYAGSMYRAISNIDIEKLSEPSTQAWKSRSFLIKESAMKIANSADNLAEQRNQISQLSLNLLALMKTSSQEKPVYLFHCTKSNDEKGGNWLSLENTFDKNPFQNDDSEPCGFLVEVLK